MAPGFPACNIEDFQGFRLLCYSGLASYGADWMKWKVSETFCHSEDEDIWIPNVLIIATVSSLEVHFSLCRQHKNDKNRHHKNDLHDFSSKDIYCRSSEKKLAYKCMSS